MPGGEQFGRYQLIKLAGEGGMAQVHLARQVGPQGFVKPCVLKRIAPNFIGDQKIRRMFLQEARLSAILNHPHIVQTFDFGEVQGTPYMAMELVDGVNLAQLCRTLAASERWIPLRSSVEICIAVAEALEYAHHLKDLDSGKTLNVVHRDVSPQNILLSRQGGVKLADFGIARHDARDDKTIGPSSKGKPGYMAPEQSLAVEIDGRADLFALGIVFTELVSARRVMKTPGVLLQLPRRITELFAIRDDVPPGLLELALSMASVEPDDRPKSARDVAVTLRKIAAVIPEKHSLPVFLDKVFSKFFPDPLAAAPAVSSTSFESGDPFEGEKTIPDQHDWVKREPEEGSFAAAYGWPAEYLDSKMPQLELVGRSSSVDAMKFFAAQGSVKEEPPPPNDKPLLVFGQPHLQRAQTPAHGSTSPSAGPQLLPGLPKVLLGQAADGDPGELERSLGRRKAVRAYGPLVGVGAAVALVGLIAIVGISQLSKKKAVVEHPRGSITVTSVPPGAHVILDGIDSKQSTPVTIAGLPLDRPVRVQVSMDGFTAVPSEATVSIPDTDRKTNAYFVLRRGRVFRLETTPESASIEINGRRLSEVTPASLPAVPFGDSATITLALAGYLEKLFVLRADARTATVTQVALELGKEVDIVSEPPGARIFVDGRERGLTPLYDLLVPTARKFKVRVDKKGYKKWQQTMSAKQVRERLIEADLEQLPLLAMPMSKDDLREAKDWDRKISKLRSDMRGAKAKLAAVEKKLEQVESQPNIFIGRVADAQKDVDDWRAKVESIDTEIAEVDAQIQSFRDRVMANLEE